MGRFALPPTLPESAAGLEQLHGQALAEAEVFRARRAAKDSFTVADVARLEYLVESQDRMHERVLASQGISRGRVLKLGPKYDQLAAAAHEGGHAAITLILGGQVDRVEVLRAGRPTDLDGTVLRGNCRCVPFDFAKEQQRHLIAAAGPIAQAVAMYGAWPNHQQIEGLLAGQRDADEMRKAAFATGSDRIPAAVLPMVMQVWPAITRLAVQMYHEGPIGHDDVTAALGLSKDRSQHAFELAAIRSGLRSVPVPKQIW